MFKPGNKVQWFSQDFSCDDDPCQGIVVEKIDLDEGTFSPKMGQSFVLWTDACTRHMWDKYTIQNVRTEYLREV